MAGGTCDFSFMECLLKSLVIGTAVVAFLLGSAESPREESLAGIEESGAGHARLHFLGVTAAGVAEFDVQTFYPQGDIQLIAGKVNGLERFAGREMLVRDQKVQSRPPAGGVYWRFPASSFRRWFGVNDDENLDLGQWNAGTHGLEEGIRVPAELIVIDCLLEADDEGRDRFNPLQIFDKKIEPIRIANRHRGMPRIRGGGAATAAQKVGGGRCVGGGRELPEECHDGRRGARGAR